MIAGGIDNVTGQCSNHTAMREAVAPQELLLISSLLSAWQGEIQSEHMSEEKGSAT